MAYSTPLTTTFPDAPSEIDGEPVLFAAVLSERWKRMRMCSCTAAFCCAPPLLGLLTAPLYMALGSKARQEEKESWHLLLTPTALHFRQKIYGCGCCCQSTKIKAVPLDKIQDILLVSDCCGDCCGFSEGEGKPYLMHVQTAGFSGSPEGAGTAELTVACVIDPETFRKRVLAAKRHLMGIGTSASASGAAKEAALSAPVVGGDMGRVEAVLSRMEVIMQEAVEMMRSKKATGSHL
jgi:hypothetical protein